MDYRREEGVSFNPRPARIPLILIGDADVRSGTVLAASMIATVLPRCASTRNYSKFPEEVRKLAELAVKSPSELTSIPAELSEDCWAIACALWLDRMRHLHLCRPDMYVEWPTMIKQTDVYANFAEQACPRIAQLLRAWQLRFVRQPRFRELVRKKANE